MWVDRLTASTAVLVSASQRKGHAESRGANWFVVCVLLPFLVLALIKAGSRNSWLYCHCLLSVFGLNCSVSTFSLFSFFSPHASVIFRGLESCSQNWQGWQISLQLTFSVSYSSSRFDFIWVFLSCSSKMPPVHHSGMLSCFDVHAEKWCVMKEQVLWISDNLASLLRQIIYAVTLPMQICAAVRRAYAGSRAFCQCRVYYLTEVILRAIVLGE